MYIDYYKTLGITKTATPADIKNAYRKMARKYHPDLNPNDKEAVKNFQQINEANEVLSNPEKRKKFDQYGEDWKHSEEFEKAKQNQQQTRRAQSSAQYGGQSESDFSDFFESMFGGAANTSRGRQQRFRGEDFNAELHLSLKDAYTTHKQMLTVNGKNIRITIPAGVENGQTIKIVGHGAKGGHGALNGDLLITFVIENDKDIKRLGNNLYSTVDLDLFTAVLGGDILIDTLSAKVKLKVQPETQNGTKIKLKGKGFPIYKDEPNFGDLFITYSLKIPTNLTENQKKMFAELKASM